MVKLFGGGSDIAHIHSQLFGVFLGPPFLDCFCPLVDIHISHMHMRHLHVWIGDASLNLHFFLSDNDTDHNRKSHLLVLLGRLSYHFTIVQNSIT